ncbi:hypothetical protein [Neobacillus vireti]|uniref:hypothetical protein n=1 Tax=Neobacillus vireti TaxID=220686 RepID=UPI0030009402
MMFSRIALFASLLFFLCGTAGFAYTHLEKSSPSSNSVPTDSFHNHSTLTVVTSSNKHSNIQTTDSKNTKNQTGNAVLLMKKNQSTQPSFKDYVVPATVCLFLMMVLGGYWFGFRRKLS